MLVIHRADIAGPRVSDFQPFIFVIAGGGDERQGFAIRRKLNIVPTGPTPAAYVIAEGAAVFVGRDLKAYHLAAFMSTTTRSISVMSLSPSIG